MEGHPRHHPGHNIYHRRRYTDRHRPPRHLRHQTGQHLPAATPRHRGAAPTPLRSHKGVGSGRHPPAHHGRHPAQTHGPGNEGRLVNVDPGRRRRRRGTGVVPPRYGPMAARLRRPRHHDHAGARRPAGPGSAHSRGPLRLAPAEPRCGRGQRRARLRRDYPEASQPRAHDAEAGRNHRHPVPGRVHIRHRGPRVPARHSSPTAQGGRVTFDHLPARSLHRSSKPVLHSAKTPHHPRAAAIPLQVSPCSCVVR